MANPPQLLDLFTAIYNACLPLCFNPNVNPSTGAGTPSAAQPFANIAAYAGQLSTKEQVHARALGQMPSVLIAFVNERPKTEIRTVSGDTEIACPSRWAVVVATTDPRDMVQGLDGSPAKPGIYAMADLVLATLNNLQIANLLRANRLEYQGQEWARVGGGGIFALALNFVALRAAPDAAVVYATTAYAGTTMREHLRDTPAAPSVSTTIASGSAGLTLPQATINVFAAAAFPSTGTITVATSAGLQTVTYTGTTPTSFTGCSGGTGTMSAGAVVESVAITDPIVTAKDS